MPYVIAIVCTVIGFMFGASTADHATLKDCATKGIAKMAGGGTIKCEVVKEEAK